MVKVQERISSNELKINGNIPDILTYLEMEQQRCPKMTVPQYIRLRKLERAETKQFCGEDIRKGYNNVLR